MLILYSAALLNSFIIGETFTIVSLGFSSAWSYYLQIEIAFSFQFPSL